MDVVVTRTPDGWAARRGETAAGTAAALVRPDGRCFVVNRREHTYAVPTVTGPTDRPLPAGFQILTADRVREDRLRALDDELEQDVPGADGWRWDRRGFRRETYDAPDDDPATYLVAVERATGRSAGLVRVWHRLLAGLGARRTGGIVELVRPWPAAGPA